MSSHDRYGSDVLSSDWRKPKRGHSVDTPVEKGMVVEDATTGFCGEVVKVDRDIGTVTLEDRRNRRKVFPLGPGFHLDGKPVTLRPPVRSGPVAPTRTASGSMAVQGAKARVARASRIYVEGRHDAELVEKVWGEDLRLEGVVVEYLGGVDDLGVAPQGLRAGPVAPGRRARRPPGARGRRRAGSPTPYDAGRTGRTCSSWATPTSTSGRP